MHSLTSSRPAYVEDRAMIRAPRQFATEKMEAKVRNKGYTVRPGSDTASLENSPVQHPITLPFSPNHRMSRSVRQSDVLQLQQTIGNQAVLRLLEQSRSRNESSVLQSQ